MATNASSASCEGRIRPVVTRSLPGTFSYASKRRRSSSTSSATPAVSVVPAENRFYDCSKEDYSSDEEVKEEDYNDDADFIVPDDEEAYSPSSDASGDDE